MKLIIGYQLCILLLIGLYHQNEASSSSLTNAKLDGTDTTHQNSVLTGECLNNSVDSKCNLQPSAKLASHNSYDMETPNGQGNSASQLDGPMELMNRLQEIDRLDKSLLLNSDSSTNSTWRSTDPGSSLRQVVFVHRHGDRTPINFPPKDKLVSEPFWAFHGYGQLTNRGKARLYLLGQIIRQRYNTFLRGSVNKNQRISRSSGSLRCIESAQVFLSSFLELDLPGSLDGPLLNWSIKSDEHLGRIWQPASVQSVPTTFDGMLAEGAECQALTDEYMNVTDKSDEVKNIHIRYHNEAFKLKSLLGFEIDHFYKWFWISSQIEVERSYFAAKMNPEILKIYDRVQEAGNLALGAYQRTVKSKQLRSGLLINDIVDKMKTYREQSSNDSSSSQDLKKFVHYAGHDLTLVVLLGMLDSWKTGTARPDYASNIAIELHQEDNEWFLKIYYMAQVPSEPVELHLTRCEDKHPNQRCTLDNFVSLMNIYMISDWQTWMQACNNDLQKVNPYLDGK